MSDNLNTEYDFDDGFDTQQTPEYEVFNNEPESEQSKEKAGFGKVISNIKSLVPFLNESEKKKYAQDFIL